MARSDLVRSNASGKGLRLVVSTLAVLILPPFLAAAIVPLALLLFPVAWLAIPFIVATLLGDAVSAGAAPKPKRVARRLSMANAAYGGTRAR
jgi:hypothetical protein